MSAGDRAIRNDERKQQLTMLSWLLNATGVVVLLVGTAVYYFAFDTSLSATEQDLQDRVVEVRKLLSHRAEIRENLREAEAKLAQQQERAAAVRNRIPDPPNVAEFLQSSSQAAANSGLRIPHFSRGEVTRNATFSQIDIRLECEGTYEDICEFLNELEQIPRVARVISMDIKAEASDVSYPLVMVIRLYFGVHPATDVQQTTLLAPPHSQPFGMLRVGCHFAALERGGRWHG